MTSFEWPPEGSGSGGGVTSLNGDMGDILLVSLDGSISITPDTPSRGDINLESMGKISSINADSTPDQILDVGTAGSDFNIADSTRGEHTFNLPDASASSRGALTSADWSTFDGKQDALTLGDLTSTPTTNLVVTGGSGAVVGSGALLTLTGASLVEATSSVLTITGASNAVLGTGVSIAVKEAGTSQDGYLSSTDWNTFNSKGSGTVTGISVATANGLAGSSSGGATPALTLSTTLTTPVIAGNGTALIAATTTGSGSVVLGTAPTITLPNATGLPLTTGVTGVLPIANGGTDNGSLAVTAGGVLITDGIKFQNVGAGTSGQVLTSGGASAATWANSAAVNQSYVLQNLGLAVSVGSSALTIALKQGDGTTDPASGSGTVIMGYRSATATSGAFTLVNSTSALSIVVPSGATLGQVSGMNQYVWVYAINNSGTTELAVSGVSLFQDNSIQSTTAITSGSTSGSVLYSTTARTNVPIRLIGRMLVNETTAGTWASVPSDVITAPKAYLNFTDTIAYTSSITGVGTVTSSTAYYKREGDSISAWGMFTCGVVSGSVVISVSLPSGLSIDTSKIPTTLLFTLGELIGVANTTTNAWPSTTVGSGPYPAMADTATDSTKVYFGRGTASNTVVKATADNWFISGNSAQFNFRVPILGWSAYGP